MQSVHISKGNDLNAVRAFQRLWGRVSDPPFDFPKVANLRTEHVASITSSDDDLGSVGNAEKSP